MLTYYPPCYSRTSNSNYILLLLLLIATFCSYKNGRTHAFFILPQSSSPSQKILNAELSHHAGRLLHHSTIVVNNMIPHNYEDDDSVKNNNPKVHQNNNRIVNSSSRNEFLKGFLSTTILFSSTIVNAFDGGVGGLGKTKPETGVVFANTVLNVDGNTSTRSSNANTNNSSFGGAGSFYNTELISPSDDKTIVLLSFYAPWPMLRSSSGIESRDLSNPEAAFVQVATLPPNLSSSSSTVVLPTSFFTSTIFGPTGKFGMYGTPTDIKVQRSKKYDTSNTLPSTSSTSIYIATFTTLTPAMRESERKAFISVSIIGNAVFMLVTGTTMTRFKSQESILENVAKSFACVLAPMSNLRR